LGLEAFMMVRKNIWRPMLEILIARLPGNVNAPSLVFSAHMDTIPIHKKLEHVIKDGIISSDGTTILEETTVLG